MSYCVNCGHVVLADGFTCDNPACPTGNHVADRPKEPGPHARLREAVRTALEDVDRICDEPPSGLSVKELSEVRMTRARILAQSSRKLLDALTIAQYRKGGDV